MMTYFRQKELHKGLHEDLYLLFKEALSTHLGHISTDIVLKLAHSTLGVRQKLGFFLLQKNVNHADLTIRELIKLADSETVDIRQWVCGVFTSNVPRIKYEAAEALRILDAKWDDVRIFAFDFFKTHFQKSDWTPERLIFVCDSTRHEVQQFGKTLITQYFRSEDGQAYLLQLSQHPSANLQNFATHYIEQFAADNPENIEKLRFYFALVLSQINRSGVAKARIFTFLEQEALKNTHVATLVSELLTRQSLTVAVADKAACIRILTKLKRQFPQIQSSLSVKEV